MKTAEMEAKARQIIADLVRDGEAGKLDAAVHRAVLDGLRQRLGRARPSKPKVL